MIYKNEEGKCREIPLMNGLPIGNINNTTYSYCPSCGPMRLLFLVIPEEDDIARIYQLLLHHSSTFLVIKYNILGIYLYIYTHTFIRNLFFFGEYIHTQPLF